MEEKKSSLWQLGFLIVILLTLGLVFLKHPFVSVSEEETSSSTRQSATENVSLGESGEAQPTQGGKWIDPTAFSMGDNRVPRVHTRNQKRALAVQRYLRRPEGSFSSGDMASPRLDAGRPSSSFNGYSSSNMAASSPVGISGYSSNPAAVPAVASSRRGGASPITTRSTRGQYAGVYRPTAREKMKSELALLPGAMTKEQSEKLQRQLNSLGPGIERALARALLPKGKKDSNIEKYLARRKGGAAATGPFAGVLNQVATQKAGIMASLGEALGEEAADEAGRVMDSFQNELASTLNQPGLSPEQLTQKTRALSEKYNKKLQNVSEKHSLKKYEQNLAAQDADLTAGLAKAYGPEIASKAETILAAARQKELSLALQGLPEDEYLKQRVDNQHNSREALQNMLLQNGLSLKEFKKLEDVLEGKRVNEALQKEAEGITLARDYKPEQKQDIMMTVRQEQKHNLQSAQAVYGEEGAARINEVYQQYIQDIQHIVNDETLSFAEKEKQRQEARLRANEELSRVQQSPEMVQLRENIQVQGTLSQIMQDPGFQRADPEQKQIFVEHATPILKNMWSEVNKIQESDLPKDEKERRIAAAQVKAQQQLSGQ